MEHLFVLCRDLFDRFHASPGSLHAPLLLIGGPACPKQPSPLKIGFSVAS
ncbi:hypothetical protein RRSWK_06792 [Rhodopirellula sp. SWK7]|nr:hypothetical protein RRSWK_06792 [Rhodopirellula sp. SWK7]